MGKQEPRLRFTDEERADPALNKPIRRAEQAAAKADRAQARIPRKQVKRAAVDPNTGRVTTKLVLEDRKKPPSKLAHTVKDTPVNAVIGAVHREIRTSEQDNVGVESAHRTEEAAETAGRLVREGYHSHKLKPYRNAAKAERHLEKANVNALYQKSLRENPQLASNPISRWQQKQAIRKQYAAAKRAGEASGTAARAAGKAAGATKRGGGFLRRHKKGVGTAIAFLLLLAMLFSAFSSCSVLLQGALSGVAATTYPSADADMLGAEAAYARMEAELQSNLDSYESTHNYDEYHFELDEIGHDPYVLVSLLTAYYEGAWTLSQVQGVLAGLFDRQYTLTETVEVETRYRTETVTGSRMVYDEVFEDWVEEEYEYESEVPYAYSICTVTLQNFDLSHLPVYLLTEEQLGVYAGYMATSGNRPDLFPQSDYPGVAVRQPFTDYDIPPEALEDEVFAAMIAEAEKYLGWPYVWGGSSPSTSFDCSGFVCWVINHSGWDVGRLTANGLLDFCTPVSSANARPGDLVFFQGTYDTAGASHVGIYVGNGMMIHAGDPISYTSIDTTYWQSHFYTFARLP